MTRILWVEDQMHWVERFRPVLERTAFGEAATEVQVFKFAEAACQHIQAADAHQAPDVALLDANMNGNDAAGFSVARRLQRKWPQVPVIYLSEHSGTEIEQHAFEDQATSDFIAKHQRNIEAVLCWRIKAALRQRQMQDATAGLLLGQVLRSGDLSIDTTTWEVYWKAVKLMNPANPKRPLAPTPRKILRYLVEAAPAPLTTWQIAVKLDADPEHFSYANYRQHIRTLRRSFDQALSGSASFSQLCKVGEGIVTFGDQGAYFWKPPRGVSE